MSHSLAQHSQRSRGSTLACRQLFAVARWVLFEKSGHKPVRRRKQYSRHRAQHTYHGPSGCGRVNGGSHQEHGAHEYAHLQRRTKHFHPLELPFDLGADEGEVAKQDGLQGSAFRAGVLS